MRNYFPLPSSSVCGLNEVRLRGGGESIEAGKEAVLRRGPHREHIHALAPHRRERRQRTPAPETRASRTGRTSAPAADTPPYALPSGLSASYRTSTAAPQSFVKSLEVLEYILVRRASGKEAPLLLHLLLLRINQFNDQEGEGEESGGGGRITCKEDQDSDTKALLSKEENVCQGGGIIKGILRPGENPRHGSLYPES